MSKRSPVSPQAASRGRAPVAYARLIPELQRIVGRNVRAPEAVIEEACQIAWSDWLIHRNQIEQGSVLGWLSTTATRAALRLLSIQAKQAVAVSTISVEELAELPFASADPEQIVELRERLAEVRRLPVRQQRMLWLQGFGYDYREIGDRTGDTRRTVERQLLRARRRLVDSSDCD